MAYSFGLGRTETRMLDIADFGPNPQGPEFGEYGIENRADQRWGLAGDGWDDGCPD